jgi:hypothetical protein
MSLKTLTVLSLCTLALPLAAQPLNVPWSSYGHDAQHSGVSSVASQAFNRVKWSTPVDIDLQNTSGELLIHYGSPLVTAKNTVIVPVRASSSTNTYRIDVFSGVDGSFKYTLPTDWTPPPHNWVPVFGPVVSARTRLWYPGPGGTVYYRDQPDSNTGPSGQIAFFGNALYAANQAAFNSAVQISTPIISDRYGDIFFGFTVTGSNPASLVSGVARIDFVGNGSYVSALAASGGDGNIGSVPTNCAPALSLDSLTLYFAVSGGNGTLGYLVSVDSRTLAPVHQVLLKDPEFGSNAALLDISSASPTVGPDGDVYYGVFETNCCTNHDRGWLLHFDKTLANSKIPGAFGWDTTASIVPSTMVPSYHGSSAYLLFTKYNNYAGTPGGDGLNKIAILDPNNTETDPITGVTVMNEVLTLLGLTSDGPNGQVKEWCINSAAVDPFTKSIIANSEDGVVYRWDLTSPGAPTQQLRLSQGVGEAYTPTVIGVDGTGYAINDAVLYAFGQ